MFFYDEHFFEKNFTGGIFYKLNNVYKINCNGYLTDFSGIEDVVDTLFDNMKNHPVYEDLVDYYSGELDDISDEDLVFFFGNFFAQALYNGLRFGCFYANNEPGERKALLSENAYDFTSEFYEDVVSSIKTESWYEKANISQAVDYLVVDAYSAYGELANEPVNDSYLRTAFDFIFGLGVGLYCYFTGVE